MIKRVNIFLTFKILQFLKLNFFISFNDDDEKPKEENCLFLFRNFKDEMLNLKYRHFILMIKKDVENSVNNKDEINDSDDTNEELNNCLENLFKNKNKYKKADIVIKNEDKNMKEITYFFNYEKNKEIKKELINLKFLKKIKKNEN